MPPAEIALEGREDIGIDAHQMYVSTFSAKGGKMAEEEDPNAKATKLAIAEDPTDSSTAPETTVSRAIVLNLVDKIKSDDTEEIRLAVIELRLLSKWDMNNRVVIGEAGGIPLIVSLLTSSESEIQENAVTALLNLSIFHANRTAIMETTGALESISQVLLEGLTWHSKENCAALLSSLLVVEEYRDIVGTNVALLNGLRELLNTARIQGKKDALRAIFHLALWPANRSRLATADIVPILRALLGSPRAGLIEDTLSVLAKVALCTEGTDALKDGKTISMIIDFLQHGSRLAKENATSLLLALCQTGGACVEEEVRRHSITVVGTMCTLRAIGSPRAKAKASELMKVVVGSESPYRSGNNSSRSYGSGSSSDTSSPRSPSDFRSPRSPTSFRSV